MDAADLFAGIAVVIDDDINKNEPNLTRILEELARKHMPVVKYEELPNEEATSHFHGVSFVVLDWQFKNGLSEEDQMKGVKLPSGITNNGVGANIDFIRKLRETCFVPVFILTNYDSNSVIQHLEEASLYNSSSGPNSIFVKSKADIKDTLSLFEQVGAWLKETPSVYILRSWDRAYQKAKADMFRQFEDLSPAWAPILWSTFKDDHTNSSKEIGEIIDRNLYSRMGLRSIKGEYIDSYDVTTQEETSDELRKVLEGARFISNDFLVPEEVRAGDIFKIRGKYYVNIRPDCDCIPDRCSASADLQDVELYLLPGQRKAAGKLGELYNKDHGNFKETIGNTIIAYVAGEEAIDFRFKKLKVLSCKDVLDKRIGRLLPPFITRIQQRYTLYLQRQALPRHPDVWPISPDTIDS